MQNFEPAAAFGPDTASRYDDSLRGDEDAAVAYLSELVGDGRALEFAIGTGRIAVPLAARGVGVSGIELSPHMLERLRSKRGGAEIEVVEGDMSSARVPGAFDLVYLVYNTIFNILTQDGQIACFENAARHLADEGAFVVEAAVPSAWAERHAFVNTEWIETDGVGIEVAHYDAATQIFEKNHVVLSATEGLRFGPIVCRLIWPAEMDLMARIAGLRLSDRWGGWNGEPFTADSKMHVSAYRRL